MAFSCSRPAMLKMLPSGSMISLRLRVLRRVWVQQYLLTQEKFSWRSDDNIPPASILISSPYDLDAHMSIKQSTIWTGYKVHLTETCDEERPHLIIHVETTPATTQDMSMTEPIHQRLSDKGSGSCEKDSPVEIIAMKKEQEASLMHDLRCAKRRASCAQNERDAAARCYSTARHGQFLPSLFPQRYAVPVGSPPDTLPRSL